MSICQGCGNPEELCLCRKIQTHGPEHPAVQRLAQYKTERDAALDAALDAAREHGDLIEILHERLAKLAESIDVNIPQLVAERDVAVAEVESYRRAAHLMDIQTEAMVGRLARAESALEVAREAAEAAEEGDRRALSAALARAERAELEHRGADAWSRLYAKLEAELARYRDARVDGVDVGTLLHLSEPDPDRGADDPINALLADTLTVLRYAAARAAEDAAKPEALVWEPCNVSQGNGLEVSVGCVLFRTQQLPGLAYLYIIGPWGETCKSFTYLDDARAEATRIARALGLLRRMGEER